MFHVGDVPFENLKLCRECAPYGGLLAVTVGSSSFPNEFVLEILTSENCIHNHLEVVTHGGVAMEIY